MKENLLRKSTLKILGVTWAWTLTTGNRKIFSSEADHKRIYTHTSVPYLLRGYVNICIYECQSFSVCVHLAEWVDLRLCESPHSRIYTSDNRESFTAYKCGACVVFFNNWPIQWIWCVPKNRSGCDVNSTTPNGLTTTRRISVMNEQRQGGEKESIKREMYAWKNVWMGVKQRQDK